MFVQVAKEEFRVGIALFRLGSHFGIGRIENLLGLWRSVTPLISRKNGGEKQQLEQQRVALALANVHGGSPFSLRSSFGS